MCQRVNYLYQKYQEDLLYFNLLEIGKYTLSVQVSCRDSLAPLTITVLRHDTRVFRNQYMPSIIQRRIIT